MSDEAISQYIVFKEIASCASGALAMTGFVKMSLTTIVLNF